MTPAKRRREIDYASCRAIRDHGTAEAALRAYSHDALVLIGDGMAHGAGHYATIATSLAQRVGKEVS